MVDWCKDVEESIKLIIDNLDNRLETDIKEFVERYISHDELEMAMEILLLTLIEDKIYPNNIKLEKIIFLAKELNLDTENYYDDNFWIKFNEWIKKFPPETKM
jgi:hypothetical protein